MASDFWVWTFIHDVSGVESVRLWYRIDEDGENPLTSTQNETYLGGPEVEDWQSLAMTRRVFPPGNVYNDPEIDFSVLPSYIADQYSAQITGLDSMMVDYYAEATDVGGRVRRSPIQHVYVGGGDAGSSSPAVTWEPMTPQAGGALSIHYDPIEGALPDASPVVHIHAGHSGWTDVIDPDPQMIWNESTARFDYTYSIPAAATSVDFVFHDGAGNWDNNGGADWHVPVDGSSPLPFTLDGVVDPGVPLLATCDGHELYGQFDGRYLYLAAPGVQITSGLDHFILVRRPATTGTRAAMWAKSGTVPEYDLLLGCEDSNGWVGWFDGSDASVGGSVWTAQGAVVEGLIDCESVWGSTPGEVRVVWAGYASPDGGALEAQAPCGNADGALETSEMTTVSSSTTDAPSAGNRGLELRLLSPNPLQGALRAIVTAAPGHRVSVVLFDLRGRRVERLYEGPATGPLAIETKTLGRLPAGVYFLTARSGPAQAVHRLVLLP
jgi:hypothetical protein